MVRFDSLKFASEFYDGAINAQEWQKKVFEISFYTYQGLMSSATFRPIYNFVKEKKILLEKKKKFVRKKKKLC